MEERCISLAPMAAPGCRVLVLGSMPGTASLRAAEYYAHPRNAFWQILYALWDAGAPPSDYADRLAFALSHRVALWDTAHSCLRQGSSDASIREAVPNDFAALFQRCPHIHTIVHNGRLSASLLIRIAPDAAGGRQRHLLPSTSPAHTLSYTDKLAAWRVLRLAADTGDRSR